MWLLPVVKYIISIATLNKLFIFAIRGRCRCRQLQQWIQKLNWLDSFTHKFNMHTCEGTVAVARWSERCSDVHSKCFICTTNLFKYTNEERTSNEKRGKVVACHRYGKTQSVTGCQWEHSYRSCCAAHKEKPLNGEKIETIAMVFVCFPNERCDGEPQTLLTFELYFSIFC